ncbi:hypothetical protein CVT26_012122 [Gymnopilus dilepis]|uniref:Uncharacterized protein n=1 Tax=Gymnopilus dilepis TaxID=231916 RepID=A0A409YGL7_9AGAR|nr:hypothetical protein CVT26_012122 [Gymnopilus dilepis]
MWRDGNRKKTKLPPLSLHDQQSPIPNPLQSPLPQSCLTMSSGQDGDEPSLADLEKEQERIAEEVKRRKRAALKAQREAEQQQLIAAGEG